MTPSSHLVKSLQQALVSLGHQIAVDSVYGPKTHSAVMARLGLGETVEASGQRKVGPKGLALIAEFEGLRLEAYPDPATGGEPYTIGVGHTGGVKKGDRITGAQADAFLRADLSRFEKAVNRLAPTTTQNQFDALVSLAFNVGEGNLASSTLLKLHNAGDYAGAAQQFGKWVNAAGKRMSGLVRRRKAEAALYRL